MPKGNPNPSPATRFKKGSAPKTAGRPVGKSLLAELNAIMKELDPITGKPNRRAAAMKLVTMALSGNMEAQKLLWDRYDGKQSNTLGIGGIGADGKIGPVIVNMVPFNAGSNG